MKKRFFSLAMLVLFASSMLGFAPATTHDVPKNAQTYCVAPSGNDASDGSAGAPWQTLGKAAQTMRPGDTCIIRGGTYNETLTPGSGSEGAPITYKTYDGEKVVINGANEVTGFTHYDGNIYVADTALTLGDKNQVFVDGEMGFNARWPNTQTGKLYEGFATVESGSSTTINDPALAKFGDGFFKGATLWLNAGSRWTSQTATVQNHTSGTITFTPLGLTDVHNTPTKGNTYYLSNVYGALDSQNEWYYDEAAGKLYIYGDPTGKTVQVKARETAIDLDNASYVNIEGVEVLGAAITGTGACHVTLDRVTASYGAHSAKIVNPYGTDVASIKLFGNNNVISNSEVAYSSATGVWLSGDGNLLFNSSIHDTDYIGSYGACINISGAGNVISHNTAYNTGRDIIIIQSGSGCKIQYNDFSHSGMVCADLGLLYTVATDGGGTEICYNRFHDNLSSGSRSGIYLDNGTSNWLVHHNVVWNAGTALQLNIPSNYVTAYNNTFIGNINQDFAWVFKNDAWGDRVVNNLVVGNIGLKEETIARSNLKCVDPGFVDSATHQYNLTANSTAIDVAEEIPGITDGYAGAGPDMGAYEYGQKPWTSGCNLKAPPAMPAVPAVATKTRFANSVENAGFEASGLKGWITSGSVSKATPGAGQDPIQMNTGYTRTGYGSAKLTGSDKQLEAKPLDENFTSGGLSDWNCDVFTGTRFSVQDGALQLGNVEGQNGECRVLYTGENYQDAVYEATLKILNSSTNSQDLGLVARYMSSASYIYFSYAPWRAGSGKTYQICRRVGTGYTELTSSAGTVQLQPDQTYNLHVEMDGENLKWYVNGELQVEATDTSPAAGKIGVGQYLGDGTGLLCYDNVKVTPIMATAPAALDLADPENPTNAPKATIIAPADTEEPVSNRQGVLSQTISVQPGITYTLTAWAKVEPGEELTLGTQGGDSVTVSESKGGVWTRHQIEYTAADYQTEMTIYFKKTSDGPNAVYVDDIGVTEKEAPVEYNAEPRYIALSNSSAALSEKDALQLTATVLPFNAKAQDVKWSSNNPSVATVNETGNVLGVKSGSATVTATVKGYPNISVSCAVTVTPGTAYPVYNLTDTLADKTSWTSDGNPLFRDRQVTLESMKTLASTKKFENGALFCLRMKLDFKSAEWYGVGVASTHPLNYAWSDNGLYHLVIKRSQFELQKWGNGGGGANQVVVKNTGLVKDGEFFDFKMGAIPENGGMRIVVEINDQRIISWLDTSTPFVDPGYLNFYNQGTGTMTLAASESSGGSPTPVTPVTPRTPKTPTTPVTPEQSSFVSDTNAALSVDGSYTFKITSKDGKVPAFIVGTPGVFDTELVRKIGDDYFYKITATGAAGAQTGIYVNGSDRLLVATVKNNPSYVVSDTTGNFKVKAGQSYMFKLTANTRPSFVAGTSSVFEVSFVKRGGSDYFFRVTTVGKSGCSSVFYINRQNSQKAVAVATVA